MANILTADDSPSIQQMVRLTLESLGHDVTTVDDGSIALEQAKEAQYDFVITDINMPNMGGFELIQKLRELDNYKMTPIVCLTTESSDSYKKQGKEAGANGWIVKPFDPADLSKILDRLL